MYTALSLTGCASSGFSWDRVADSAKFAVTDPVTWAPVAAAAALKVTDFDDRLTEKAIEESPVFDGTERDIGDKTDDLQTIGRVSVLVTTLFTDEDNSYVHRGREFNCGDIWQTGAVDLFSIVSTDLTTGTLKNWVDRERPNGRGDNSFPSGHAGSGGVTAALGARQIDCTNISSKWVKTGVKTSFYTLGALTGWGRVEAERHFVSDVLVGYSIGNFFAEFFNHYYFANEGSPMRIAVSPVEDGALLMFSAPFR